MTHPGGTNMLDTYMERTDVKQGISIAAILGVLIEKGITTEAEYNNACDQLREMTREKADKDLKDIISENPLYKILEK